MGAATGERTRRSAHRTPGPSRRQRSNDQDGAPPPRPAGAPRRPRSSISRTGRVGPALRQLVLVEAATAVAMVGAALGGAWMIPAGVIACLLILLALVRRRGRAVQDWLSTVSSLRHRRRAAEAPSSETEPQLAPVTENVPGFAPYIYVDGARRTVGMIGDGTFLTAVVRVEASGESLRQAMGARSLPCPSWATPSRWTTSCWSPRSSCSRCDPLRRRICRSGRWPGCPTVLSRTGPGRPRCG